MIYIIIRDRKLINLLNKSNTFIPFIFCLYLIEITILNKALNNKLF